MSNGESKTDRSKWLQIITPVVIALVGGLFTWRNEVQQEKNRSSQMVVQLMADREKSETEFRRDIFMPLIDKIIDGIDEKKNHHHDE